MKWLNEKFVKVADFVSYAIGTPPNMLFWFVLIVSWFVLGIFLPHLFLSSGFLPIWFTSPAWNFPLNTLTTLIQLFVGFLVAAAANRSERRLREIVEDTRELTKEQDSILHILRSNIENMQKDLDKTHSMIGALTKEIKEQKQNEGLTALPQFPTMVI